jgi:hypothetical protein
LVFQIQQSPGGTANWDSYVTSYSTASGNWLGDTIRMVQGGQGRYRVHVDSTSDASSG